MEQDPWLTAARRIDYFRVVPRLIMAAYFAFFMKAWLLVFEWFGAFDWKSLPDDQVVGAVAAAAIAGFPTVILTILTNVLFKLTASYWNAPVATKEPE
jgi:hypothetical protein